VYISAKTDYAVRALMALAHERDDRRMHAAALARDHGMPVTSVEQILTDLRRHGLLTLQRGPEGGYQLAKVPSEIRLGEVFRIYDAVQLEVHGNPPEHVGYSPQFASLAGFYLRFRETLIGYIDSVTLADLVDVRAWPAVGSG